MRSNGQYRAAGTFTTADTPTLFGLAAAVSGGALSADTPVYLTCATAEPPTAGTRSSISITRRANPPCPDTGARPTGRASLEQERRSGAASIMTLSWATTWIRSYPIRRRARRSALPRCVSLIDDTDCTTKEQAVLLIEKIKRAVERAFGRPRRKGVTTWPRRKGVHGLQSADDAFRRHRRRQ